MLWGGPSSLLPAPEAPSFVKKMLTHGHRAGQEAGSDPRLALRDGNTEQHGSNPRRGRVFKHIYCKPTWWTTVLSSGLARLRGPSAVAASAERKQAGAAAAGQPRQSCHRWEGTAFGHCDQHPSQTLTAARWKDTTRKKQAPGGQQPVLVPISQITETQTHPPRLWGDPRGTEEHVENVCHTDNRDLGPEEGPSRCRTSQ